MERLARRVALPLVAIAALLALAPAAQAGQQAVVREIVVRGYPGDPAAIKGLIRTKEGAPLDPTTLNEDITRLLRAGHLATFSLQELPDGVRITLRVARTPKLRTVSVDGAGKSWNRKLKDELISKAGSLVSPATLKLDEAKRFLGDKERIRAYCQERGYRNAAITSTLTPVADSDDVDVAFQVALGPKFQVTRLRFQGNQGVATRELARRMQTKQDGFFTSRRYTDRFFEQDVQALQDFYRYKGYPDAKVTYRRLFAGRGGNRVHITLVVDEGKSYATGPVAIGGAKIISADTLLALVALKQGQPYSDEKLLEARRAIERRYHEEGYSDVAALPTRQLNAGTGAYDVTFAVEEGPRVTINTVRTEGHPRTQRKVILRELSLEPGDTYDVRKLEASQRALDRLQFFDSVVMKLQPTDPPNAAERDLHVGVEEGRTGNFRFGVGFSTVQSVVGTIDLTQNNFDWRDWPKSWRDLFSGNAFVGAGQQFRIALMPGFQYSNYMISYRNPYWKDKNQSFGWSLYYRDRDQGEWDESRVGLRLTRGIRRFRGDPDTDLIFHTRIESVSVNNVDEKDAPMAALDEEGSHFVWGLGATLKRDRTDRIIMPTTGYKWQASIEGVVPEGVTLGGRTTRYWTLGGAGKKGHERVFSLRAQMDYAIADFPIYERYFLGAPMLRGFDYRGAGPHDNGEPEGGDYRALISAQYRHPLIANRLYSVLFVDAGTVTDDFTGFADPRVSVGLGFRVLFPALSRAPLRLDFGVPIVDQSDDDTQVIYFSISLDR
ncbi:MAG: BamA/TamA family outer membrane protein [Candidatus Brocadiae bacterium]|nr:BamA/TamA family outer membrane protein [Candidatus Brocadiia bacterium]